MTKWLTAIALLLLAGCAGEGSGDTGFYVGGGAGAQKAERSR